MSNSAFPSSDPKKHAIRLMQAGQSHEAEALLSRYCQTHPDDAEAHFLLGSCYGLNGQYDQACEAYHRSLRLNPGVAQTHFSLGGAHKMAGRLEDAIHHFLEATRLDPSFTTARLALAETLGTLGRFSEAQEHLHQILSSHPRNAAAHYALGILAEQKDDYENAYKHFRNATRYEKNNAQFLCALGGALSALNRWQEARGAFMKALKLSPKHPDALGGLARIHEIRGEHEKARKRVELLILKNIPSVSAAIALTQGCKHRGDCHEAVKYATHVLDKMAYIPPRSRQNLHMAIARALDHMKEIDRAFHHFKAGNECIPSSYDPVKHQMMIDRMIDVFTPELMMKAPYVRNETNRPIFILGMPRSGTSLTEQILASHPDVHGGGELPYIGKIVKNLAAELGTTSSWPDCVKHLTHETAEKLSDYYLKQLRRLSKDKRHVTDKMPHNFYAVGLIKILFPDAKIIHCTRDPMDTCLSIYMQNFKEGHEYSRDLFHIGTHYHQYRRLMNHWKHGLGIVMFELSYEKLIATPEDTLKELLDFCGLAWSDRCLRFHESKRHIDTASYDQVKQPLYAGSIGRWKRYDKYLDSLREGLERGH